ncbi:MAG: Wadjet anti-phage system protein JetD domain-containing protein [Rubritalea sp.]|uniref:Wadjet anti-phage system protein JetD domain-containing protein n=1 Tax=Rubritalea sp. TaxID=2109375 RepID=UPI0032427D47
MKTPAELSKKLAKQWQNSSLRESRILHGENLPIRLPIGKPSPSLVRDDIAALRRHLDLWRNVTIGKIVTKPTTYRTLGQAIDLPTHWEISSTADWVLASNSTIVQNEHATLETILHSSPSAFHPHFVKKRSSWLGKLADDIIKASHLASLLSPNIANGAPLRAIALAGIDTKFIERHRQLIIQLLDIRYHGKVSELGLENFLGAWHDNDHWVLVSDLNNKLLPFSQQRVRTSELLNLDKINVSHILIVENEKCLLQIPEMPDTIAILGCGLNLRWLEHSWLKSRAIAYWGDIDTWGLTMLSNARSYLPTISPLLMSHEIFSLHSKDKAVSEPIPASSDPPLLLNSAEKSLYTHLLHTQRGRLEQEFLPTPTIHEHLIQWVTKSSRKLIL